LRLLDQAEQDPILLAELARAQREFLGPMALDSGRMVQERAAAATRFAEWFLLERESDVLGAIPIEVLLAKLPDSPAEDSAAEGGAAEGGAAEDSALEATREPGVRTDRELLLGSLVGFFRIESARGAEAQAIDLQDGEVIDLREQSPGVLARGDLLVGRLYAIDEGGYVASVAATLHKDAVALGEAMSADLARLDLGRRLNQLEIEHVLLRGRELAVPAAPNYPPIEHLEAELEGYLARAGKHARATSEISAALREAETPGIIVGPLLEEIAFETDADLDELRRILLELWSAQRVRALRPPASNDTPAARPDPAKPDPRQGKARAQEPGLGASLAQRIEQGLTRHEDLDHLFTDVENLFGERIDPDEPLGGNFGEQGVDDGDLAGLVAEFLWETKSEHGEEATALAALVRQQTDAPVPMLDAETLTGNDFLRLLVATYLAAPPNLRSERVLSVAQALRRFSEWLASEQDIDLESALAVTQSVFLAPLERVSAAGLALSTATVPGRVPSLWRVLATGESGIEITGLDDDAPRVLALSPQTARSVRVGDLLIAAVSAATREGAAFLGMVVVLPAGVESVLG